MKKIILLCASLLLGTFLFSGCSADSANRLTNQLTFDVSDVTDLKISYDDENITFYKSSTSELIIQEYMNEDKARYHANVVRGSGSLHISEGSKPLIHHNFIRYVEVYLPESYCGSLTVTSTSGILNLGKIQSNLQTLRVGNTSGTVRLDDVTASAVKITTTSGSVELNRIEARQIDIESTSGSAECGELNGSVNYVTSSGDLRVKSAIGTGSFKANNSGKMDINYNEVSGNLSFYNKNDAIDLKIPAELEFEFYAVTKNGSISTVFQNLLTKEDHTMTGTVGDHPSVEIHMETNNGNINVGTT